MKTLLTIVIACLFAVSTQAQNSPASTPSSTQTKPAPAPAAAGSATTQTAPTASKNCLMMKDNKMWVVKGDKSAAMTADMTLSDGTKVFTTGAYQTKDGKKMMMKNGDCIGMDGKMINAAPEAPKKAPAQPAQK